MNEGINNSGWSKPTPPAKLGVPEGYADLTYALTNELIEGLKTMFDLPHGYVEILEVLQESNLIKYDTDYKKFFITDADLAFIKSTLIPMGQDLKKQKLSNASITDSSIAKSIKESIFKHAENKAVATIDQASSLITGARATQQFEAFREESSLFADAQAEALLAPVFQATVAKIVSLTDPDQIIDQASQTRDFAIIANIAKKLQSKEIREAILLKLSNMRKTISEDNREDRFKMALRDALEEQEVA